MYPLIESIKLKDGAFFRLPYHQARFDRGLAQCCADRSSLDLQSLLERSDYPRHGLYKCRLLFGAEGVSLEFQPYVMRNVRTLALMEVDWPTRDYKSADRQHYDAAFAARGEADDVLFVRNGLLTDTSYANIAVFDGQQWKTPRMPLLFGTQRAFLLEKGLITEADIPVEFLNESPRIRLFNAMIEFGELELVYQAF